VRDDFRTGVQGCAWAPAGWVRVGGPACGLRPLSRGAARRDLAPQRGVGGPLGVALRTIRDL